MIDRINLILKAKNITARQFADEIGVQPSGLSHILGGRNNPSLDFVAKVIRRYPEIDANWLLLGRGSMYVAGDHAPQSLSERLAATPPTPAVPRQQELQLLPELTFADEESADAVMPPPPPVEQAAPQPAPQPVPQPTPQPAPQPISQPVSQSAPQPAPATEERRLVAMMLIYSDNTFVEYRPQP